MRILIKKYATISKILLPRRNLVRFLSNDTQKKTENETEKIEEVKKSKVKIN